MLNNNICAPGKFKNSEVHTFVISLNLFIYFLCRIIKIEKKLQYIFNNVN